MLIRLTQVARIGKLFLMNNYYLVWGGGAGDVVWDYLRDPSTWFLPALVRDYGARVKVITACHNPGINDFFAVNPWIHEHIAEPWKPPSPEDHVRFSNPIDGYLPLQHPDHLRDVMAMGLKRQQPEVYLTSAEQNQLASLTSHRPLIVAQPWAGLSDRDGFDSPALERLAKSLAKINLNANLTILGFNHDRTHKYAREVLTFNHPQVVNMVDRLGIRLSWHLTRKANAFVGCHSNLIRTAWDARIRNALILPEPSMTDHWPKLDPKYRYGRDYPETRVYTYPFSQEQNIARDFTQLDTDAIARFLLSGE